MPLPGAPRAPTRNAANKHKAAEEQPAITPAPSNPAPATATKETPMSEGHRLFMNLCKYVDASSELDVFWRKTDNWDGKHMTIGTVMMQRAGITETDVPEDFMNKTNAQIEKTVSHMCDQLVASQSLSWAIASHIDFMHDTLRDLLNKIVYQEKPVPADIVKRIQTAMRYMSVAERVTRQALDDRDDEKKRKDDKKRQDDEQAERGGAEKKAKVDGDGDEDEDA